MSVMDIAVLQSMSGAKEKCAFIKSHASDDEFKALLYYALNPLITYNISDKTMSKLLEESSDEKFQKLVFFNDIFQCCEYLSRLRAMDDATLRQVRLFLCDYCTETERKLYAKLLSKTLRLGVTAKTVNKIIPNLIPEWEVQQAFPIDKYPIEDGSEFWLTQKLNGARATLYNGQLIARSGLAYKGLEHITQELEFARTSGFVLDGELTLRDKGNLSDNEAFRVATGIINSDDRDKTRICYTVFDVIPIQDFESNSPQVKYSQRRRVLDTMCRKFDKESCPVRVLPVLYHGMDLSKIDSLLEQMVAEDKEGLMLNLDVPYRRTRHKGILKIKRFYTMDLPIIRCEEGTGRLAGTLGAFVLQYKENEVKVGSGFTDEQRVEFWQSREDIVGILCEVKYKEISKDKKTGLESLQFPVFVKIRNDKTDVSYG